MKILINILNTILKILAKIKMISTQYTLKKIIIGNLKNMV